jgi:hypothetical protein
VADKSANDRNRELGQEIESWGSLPE